MHNHSLLIQKELDLNISILLRLYRLLKVHVHTYQKTQDHDIE